MSSDRMETWTAKMHTIAVKTEQETVSMHVITIFTLIFLPGTFIAVRAFAASRLPNDLLAAVLTLWQTFFSSGVLDWDNDGGLRSEALRLFLLISIPMMAIIVLGWLAVYLVVRRKRNQDKAGGLDGYADEKGSSPEAGNALGILV
jgi:hypothetical protein